MNSALLLSSAFVACLCLNSCGLFSRDSRPAPVGLQQAQRYDPISRTWVALDTPTVRRAFVPPQNLPPEKAGETAKIVPPLSEAAPTAASPSNDEGSGSEQPSFLQRVGRAATSPLRAVGLGDGQ